MKQRTQEWLDFRRNKIGSSDAAAILGISPFKTPYNVWEEKVLGKTAYVNQSMQDGMDFEEEALEAFEKLTGIAMMPTVIVNENRPWQMASLDGISFDRKFFLEIKIHKNIEYHLDAKKGKIKEYYQAQVQHDYATKEDFEMGFYFSYQPKTKEGFIVEVEKENRLINTINDEETKFFEFIKNKTPPPSTEKDYVIRKSIEWGEKSKRWIDLDLSIKEMTKEKESLKDELVILSEDQSSKGCGIRVTKSMHKGLVDYDSIPQLIGVNLDAYRKEPTHRWTISACK